MKCILMFIVVLLTFFGCGSQDAHANGSKDPRLAGARYIGTGDLDEFKELIYHSLTTCNTDYLKSMIYSLEHIDKTEKQVVIRAVIPTNKIVIDSVEYKREIGENYAVPALPKGMEFSGVVTYRTPVDEGVSWSYEYTIVKYESFYRIVEPFMEYDIGELSQ